VNIEVVHVGRIKSGWIRAGIDHYCKLLSRDAAVTLRSVRESDSAALPPEKVTDEEGKRILNLLGAEVYTIVLDEHGRQFDSQALSDQLEKIKLSASNIRLVVGGAFGLSKEVKSSADLLLSLSNMTYPHELTVLLVLEQLYRAFSIRRGSKYHK
jgi:23S rRNA (pseudouridine1915-N3)-methyltransferase